MKLANTFTGLAIACVAAGSIRSEAQAQSLLQLQGPKAVMFPYIHLPFLSSETSLRKGKKDPLLGGCTMPISLSSAPGELAPGQTKVGVQRAFDASTCEEIVEEGVVDSSWRRGDERSAATRYGPLQYEEGNLPRTSVDGKALENDSSTSASGAEAAAFFRLEGFGEVYFTDGNNPFMMGDGFTLSSLRLTNTFRSDCSELPPDVSGRYNQSFRPFTGWRVTEPFGGGSLITDCIRGESTAVVRGQHSNSTRFRPFFDCRDGVSVNYSPMTFTLRLNGARFIGGSQFVSGDKNECGEYFRRLMILG